MEAKSRMEMMRMRMRRPLRCLVKVNKTKGVLVINDMEQDMEEEVTEEEVMAKEVMVQCLGNKHNNLNQ